MGAPVQWAYGCRWYFSFFSSFFSGIRERGTCRSYNKDRPLTVFPESDKCFQVTRILRSGWSSNKVPPGSCLRWKRLRSIPGFRCNLCVRNAYPVCTLLASYWGHDWESNKPCISHFPLYSLIIVCVRWLTNLGRGCKEPSQMVLDCNQIPCFTDMKTLSLKRLTLSEHIIYLFKKLYIMMTIFKRLQKVFLFTNMAKLL